MKSFITSGHGRREGANKNNCVPLNSVYSTPLDQQANA